MLRALTNITALAATLALAAPGIAAAETSPAKGDTYTWLGELVSVDPAATTMTVKSRVAYHDAVSELKNFKPGEQVWIVWSGIHDSSDAVRTVKRSQPNGKIDENLVLPAELASAEAPNQYVTLRVKVPESALASIETVEPGEWVIVTSRHRPASDADAVVGVRPYGPNTTSDSDGDL